MSRNSDIERDNVDCVKCVCVPAKVSDQGDHTIQCSLQQNPLNNWENWISRRKKIQQHLAQSVNRPAGDLLINLTDEYREIKEERLLLEYSKINTYFDKNRGNPAFWKLPPGLVDKSDRSLNPTYFANQTKPERNEIPVVTHVSTPNYVAQQKNILPSKRHLFPARYSNRSISKNSISIIQKIQSHRPECEELMVIGEKLSPQQVYKNAPVQYDYIPENLPSTDVKQDDSKNSLEEDQTIVKTCFEINGFLLNSHDELVNDLKIRLIFESTNDMRSPQVKYIKFKNKGVTTIRFCWHRIEKFLMLRDLIMSDRGTESSSFHFDKNELLLLPTETLDFPIWFKSNKVGNYFEMWEINTFPRIWFGDFKLIIILQGFVYPDNFEEKSNCIKEMLHEKAVNTLVVDIINSILQQLVFTDTGSEVFKFAEKQLFESANLEICGVEKRLKYLYNQDAVEQLKVLYEAVKLTTSPKYWNYAVKDLLILAREKDVWVYVENYLKDLTRTQQIRDELNKNVQENSEAILSLRKQSIKAEPYFHQLQAILQKLDRPSVVINTERSKYFIAYSVIRTCLFKMCDALEKYDNPTSNICDDCFPCYDYKNINALEEVSDRLIFEYFDDIWLDRSMKSSPYEYKEKIIAQPKPDCVKTISPENTKLLYLAYFNLADEEDKKKNKKNYAEASIINKRKASKDSPEPKKEFSSIIQDFDPFLEKYIPSVIPRSSKSHLSKTTSVDDESVLDYHKYLIVYNHLVEAVETMVDALETMKENTLSSEELEMLIKCNPEFQSLPEKTKQEEETVKEPASNQDYKVYFTELLNSHLNDNTKRFVIQAETKLFTKIQKEPNLQTVGSDSGSGLFPSEVLVTESVKSNVSAEVQTSLLNVDLMEDLAATTKDPRSVENLQDAGDTGSSEDVFYLMEDKEIDEEGN